MTVGAGSNLLAEVRSSNIVFKTLPTSEAKSWNPPIGLSAVSDLELDPGQLHGELRSPTIPLNREAGKAFQVPDEMLERRRESPALRPAGM